MKRTVLLIISLFIHHFIFAQTQYDYMDDEAVAGGADRVLNFMLVIVIIFAVLIIVLAIACIYFKIYYWLHPEKDPNNKTSKEESVINVGGIPVKVIVERNKETPKRTNDSPNPHKEKESQNVILNLQEILKEDSLLYRHLIVPYNDKNDVPKDLIDLITKEKRDYSLSAISSEDWENSVIDWGKKANQEHDEMDEGDATYSYNGKKFLRFDNESGLTKYNIREGVEIICDNSLWYTNDSKVIKFPSTVKVLGNRIYDYLKQDSFHIVESVRIITGNPFVNCSGKMVCDSPSFIFEHGVLYDKDRRKLISVLWDNNIQNQYEYIDPRIIIIGRFSFYGKVVDSKKPLELPPNVLYIGDSAFRSSSIDIILPDNVIEIAKSAFASSKIKNIVLPTSLCTLGEKAFYNCSSLKTISLSPNVKVIEKDTFHGCNFDRIYIPEGVKILKECCFCACTSLKEVRLPNSVERIEKYAFDLCPLPYVVVSKKTDIEEGAFPTTCKIIYRN